jgi:outer membrane protein OmpA-like peptidoglycan-associated protein
MEHMTHLQRWLLAGTVLQALQIGAGVAFAAPGAPATARDGIVVAQAPTEEELRRRQQRPPEQRQAPQPRAQEQPRQMPQMERPRPPEPPRQAPQMERPRMPEPPRQAPQMERPRPPQSAPQMERPRPPEPPRQVMPPQMERPRPQAEPPRQVVPQRQQSAPQMERPRPPEPPRQLPPQGERPRPQVEQPRPPVGPAEPQRPQRPEVMPQTGPQGGPGPDMRPRPPVPGGPQIQTGPQGPQGGPGPDMRPRPSGPQVGPQGPQGPQGGPGPDMRPRPNGPQGGPQIGPQGPQGPQGGPGPDMRPRPNGPQGGPQIGPQGPQGPQGFRPGEAPRQRPAVVPLNPMPPGPPPRDARDNRGRNNAAIGAAAGFVGGFLAGQAVGRIDDVRRDRHVVDQNGVRYYQEPGRTIIRDGDNMYIRHDETERFRDLGIRMRQERRDGMLYSSYVGAGGVTIVTVTSPDGQLLKRYRRYPNGREVIIIDNTFRGPGRLFDPDVVYIAPPPVMIPRERYIVEAEDVDEGYIEEVFRAPPIARVERRYTLDEVRQSQGLRAYMPSVDVDTITFATGSWEVTYDQANKLSTIAEAIKRTLGSNPSEVYLVEGYTDAVGSEEDNLSLSDRRAQSVAAILTKSFNVPAENLATQGYGEQYLKVDTDGPEQANRRVTIRRITPLLTGQAQQ